MPPLAGLGGSSDVCFSAGRDSGRSMLRFAAGLRIKDTFSEKLRIATSKSSIEYRLRWLWAKHQRSGRLSGTLRRQRRMAPKVALPRTHRCRRPKLFYLCLALRGAGDREDGRVEKRKRRQSYTPAQVEIIRVSLTDVGLGYKKITKAHPGSAWRSLA